MAFRMSLVLFAGALIAGHAALAASRDATPVSEPSSGVLVVAQSGTEDGPVIPRPKKKPGEEQQPQQPPPSQKPQPSSPATVAPPPSAAIPRLPPSAIPSSGSVIISQPVVPDRGNAAPAVGNGVPVAPAAPGNVAERVMQRNVGPEHFQQFLHSQGQAIGGWGQGAPMSHSVFDGSVPGSQIREDNSVPRVMPYLAPSITPSYKPTTKQDAADIMANRPSIGGGIDLEGVATGLGPINRIQYHAALNALMLDDRAAYFFPVSGRNAAVLCRAIAQDDLVGVSMAVGGVRLVYGKMPKESEVAIQLTMADSFLGNIVFADDSLGGYRFADGYTPHQAKGRTFAILVHFNFSGYRFEIADQEIRATNFSFSDELFPIAENKGKDGGMLPDYDAIAQGKRIPEFEENAQHLASHIGYYRKERIVELAFQYGEVAALLRGLKASGVDLNALAQSIEIAVGSAPRTDAAVANADDSLRMEHEWEGYLKEIQDRHHYENWSAPPYDLNTKRLAQSRARAVQTFRVARVEANDVLYIRSGPDSGLSAVGSIPPNGRGVRIVGACTGQWCQVDYNGVSGWANGYYLQPEPNQAAAVYRVIGVAANDVLNVRQGPGARFPVVGTLPPDSRGVRLASAVECVGVWCQANFQNASGWVNTLYLGTDMADAGTTYRIVNVASNDVLNIRSGPNADLAIVGTIPPDGHGVRIVGACAGQWCPIDFHGTRGWVNKQYLADD
jgi:uncharacterized protein YraI